MDLNLFISNHIGNNFIWINKVNVQIKWIVKTEFNELVIIVVIGIYEVYSMERKYLLSEERRKNANYSRFDKKNIWEC